MKKKQKFPFIILPHDRQKNESNEKYIRQIAGIAEQNNLISDRINKLLVKTGFLESLLNDFFEQDKANDIGIFFKKLMPILDNLESLRRAVESSGEDEWKTGMAFFYERLINIFSQYNLRMLAEKGAKFDSSLHEAVDAVNDPEIPSGTIVDIIENGWKYNDKVLKFARVIVAR